jgi:hypothetical protein
MHGNATTYLQQLAAELLHHGWLTDLVLRPVLRVSNPAEPDLSDDIACAEGTFCWDGGQEIGPVAEVSGAADHVMHVLRVVNAS